MAGMLHCPPPHGQGLRATYEERALDHLADAHPGPAATAYAVLALADQVATLVDEVRRLADAPSGGAS